MGSRRATIRADRDGSGANLRAAVGSLDHLRDAGEIDDADQALAELVLSSAAVLDMELERLRQTDNPKAYSVPSMQRAYLGALVELDRRVNRRREVAEADGGLGALLAHFGDEEADGNVVALPR